MLTFSQAPSRAVGWLVLCLFFCLAAVPAMAVGGDDWRPVDPSELALKTPVVEKDADAEALFWEVHVTDEDNGGDLRTVLRHYIRIKIFTDRGRESQSRVDIPFGKLWGHEIKITDIAARTIKPDGSIVELNKDDVFERTVEKASGVKVKVKSFALPGVEPGAIIEYRWRETRETTVYNRLEFSRDVPVQLVKYYIKPFTGPYFEYGMRGQFFHGQNTPFAKEKDGSYSTSMTNVPAFREEPRMPPEFQVRPWLLIYYTEDVKLTPEKFWPELGRKNYEKYKPMLKVNDDIRQQATTVIGDAATPEEKLHRLFDFCQTKIKNINNSDSGLTAEERVRWKPNKSPSDTLKRGIGSWADIDMLFAALANAAGFDARVANLANRGDVFFDPSFPDDYFINTYDIAVKVGDEWRFFDPAGRLPYGMLLWQEEGTEALISDPKAGFFVKTPMSPAEKSLEKRTAQFKLSEDGTLEGDVTIEYTGHAGAVKKSNNEEDSPTEREATLRKMVTTQMSTAEVTNVQVENVTDPAKPFTYKYHVRVPGYAQRTGKRLFLQPAFFEHGREPLFTAANRRNMIYFSYPWSEEDEVQIDLPSGFALDNADAPQPFTAGKVGKYDVRILVTKDGRTLIYKRSFFFGGEQTLLFPVESYPQLKLMFDELHKRDDHTITLKQATAVAAAPATSN